MWVRVLKLSDYVYCVALYAELALLPYSLSFGKIMVTQQFLLLKLQFVLVKGWYACGPG